ncbi:hypothetical protein HOK31_12130, partial [Candidatus Poribacteria bacterium]|nr:hypothetical protein [Candidatus Poribacteria bacterium]
MVCLLVAALVGTHGIADAGPALRRLARELRSEEYVAPTAAEFAQMKDVARRLLRGDDDGALGEADQLGYAVDQIAAGGEEFVALREREGDTSGGGLYVFRPLTPGQPAARPVVLQAPHAFYDATTGALLTRLFAATGAQALFLNTAQRYVSDDADVAHSERSYFHAVTEAACERWSEAVVVQIHGYARSGHEELPEAAHAVVSDGRDSRNKPDIVLQVVAGFADILGADAVVVYGRDAHTLGGTTNVQGRHIRRRTDDTFIHVELSREARDLLKADDDA